MRLIPSYSNTKLVGIGIDITETSRFQDWQTKSKKELKRIFSDEEIDYCLENKEKSAERFAARFAAREAFFKAFQGAYYSEYKESPKHTFVSICKHITIKKTDNGMPLCIVDWKSFDPELSGLFFYDNLEIHLSLSHTQSLATAIVAIAITK